MQLVSPLSNHSQSSYSYSYSLCIGITLTSVTIFALVTRYFMNQISHTTAKKATLTAHVQKGDQELNQAIEIVLPLITTQIELLRKQEEDQVMLVRIENATKTLRAYAESHSKK